MTGKKYVPVEVIWNIFCDGMYNWHHTHLDKIPLSTKCFIRIILCYKQFIGKVCQMMNLPFRNAGFSDSMSGISLLDLSNSVVVDSILWLHWCSLKAEALIWQEGISLESSLICLELDGYTRRYTIQFIKDVSMVISPL